MKKLLLIAASLFSMTFMAAADIHHPPGSEYTPTRKLGRALSNIFFGFMEIPEQIVRKNEDYGRKAGMTYGLVDGTKRTFRRMGYGFYELVTFGIPTNHGTFKPPYRQCGEDNRIDVDVANGLSEFPPELGFETYYHHCRSQKF